MAIERTDAELNAMIAKANERGALADATEPRAVSARYDMETDRIVIGLNNGWTFGFHPWMAQGLRGASAEQLAEVELTPGGRGLHWESLDADLGVVSLMAGFYGSKRWLSEMAAEMGKQGGRAVTPAKIAAARENGKKGGRPRKTVAESAGLPTIRLEKQ